MVSCSKTYEQDTPEVVLESLVDMISNSDVDRIPDLVYAEDENMRVILNRTGYLLERMRKLSLKIRETYPDEVAELLKTAEEKALDKAEEKNIGQRSRDDWEAELQKFLADPFGVFQEQMHRVEVVEIDDIRAAVTIDGEPAFGVGLMLRKCEIEGADNGKWFFELPQNIPWVGKSMPQTEQEWKIVALMLKSVANGIEWTETAIDKGECKSLKEVQGEVFEKVGFQFVGAWMVYQAALDARGKGKDKDKSEGDNSGGSDGGG